MFVVYLVKSTSFSFGLCILYSVYNTFSFRNHNGMLQNEIPFWLNVNDSIQLNGIVHKISHIKQIYSKLANTCAVLKSAFSPHLLVILMMKFTTLTSLLYYCCMIVLKYVRHLIEIHYLQLLIKFIQNSFRHSIKHRK